MNRIQGLSEYIRTENYRNGLGLPEEVTETYTYLAQGEYNVNYTFVHPTTHKKLVLRVNIGSQMQLDKQIEYEFHALELLQESGRTPTPIFVDGSKEHLEHGVLVMEYLDGTHLDYEKELLMAAEILADIHSVKIHKDASCKEMQLLSPGNPLQAILEECEQMVTTYYQSPLAEASKVAMIKSLMKKGWELLGNLLCDEKVEPYLCCINTELNSTNFLTTEDGKQGYLVDWEKPLLGEPAQDLGHFLAPTTTFWKTEVILTREEVDTFIEKYIDCVNNRFETGGLEARVNVFIPITCLRGITWCAMAWVEYQDPDKLIRNETTWKKLNAYLEMSYLEFINDNYFNHL